MKKVLFSPAGRIHPSQYSLIDYPPEGYEFVTQGSPLDSIVNNTLIFDKLRLQFLDSLIPLNLVKAIVFDDWLIPSGVDLVYCYNHILTSKPYVVQVEWAHILVGRSPFHFGVWRNQVGTLLKRENCKKILAWTPLAKESILTTYGSSLDNKVEVVPPAFPSRSFTRNYNKEIVRLLFIGSTNQANDFEEKGGRDTLRVFKKLRSKYREAVELVIRAKAPKDVGRALEGVTFIEYPIPVKVLHRLYKTSDIFLFPSHLYQNTSVLEAMSFGLPVVTTLVGSSLGSYVEDGKTGYVVPEKVDIFKDGLLTTETTSRYKFIRSHQMLNLRKIEELTEVTSKLIENPQLRKTLGENGKREVDKGKFSISRRNKRLKEIFDEALT